MIPEANGIRRRGVLFPLATAEPIQTFLTNRDLDFDSHPLVQVFPSTRESGAIEKNEDDAHADSHELPSDSSSPASFRVAAHQVRMLAFLEEAAGLVEDSLQTMRVRAISEWADVLDQWDCNLRGGQIEVGVKRMAGDAPKQINDKAAKLLDRLVHAPWEVPRINNLRAGVVDPCRSTSRKKPEAEEALWDPRLIVAAELFEDYGYGAQEALDLVDDWVMNGPKVLPMLQSDLNGAESLAAWHAANAIHEAVRGMFGPETRRARFDLVGDLHRLPTKQMRSAGVSVSDEDLHDAKRAVVYEIGFLVSNRAPDWSPDPDAAAIGARYSLAAELRHLVRRWYDQGSGPIRITEVRRGTGHRVDFVVDCADAKGNGHHFKGGRIHVWFREVMHPSEWGPRLLFGTSSRRWLADKMAKAWDRGLILTPTGLYTVRANEESGLLGPGSGLRAPETSVVDLDLGASEFPRMLTPHYITADELLVLQALDAVPEPAHVRAR